MTLDKGIVLDCAAAKVAAFSEDAAPAKLGALLKDAPQKCFSIVGGAVAVSD